MADLGVEFGFPFAGDIGGVDGAKGCGQAEQDREMKFENGFHGKIVLRGVISVKRKSSDRPAANARVAYRAGGPGKAAALLDPPPSFTSKPSS